MRKYQAFGLIALGFVACSDSEYDPNAPAIDPNAPRVHITSPKRGTIAGDVHTITVTGTATDDTAISSVTVNGLPANVAADGTFTVTVPVKPGTNLLHAIALDAQGNKGKESRAVVAGPMEPTRAKVPSALTASLSSQTFDALGRGAAGFIETANLGALVQPMNPVLDIGAPNGPDCLYAQALITTLDVGAADITLSPVPGGLYMNAEFDAVSVGMHLQYAVSCLDGSRDIMIGASHISVSGLLRMGVVGRAFDIKLANPIVQITGFDLNLGGIPGAVVDMLSLDTALGPILGWATERLVVPMLNNALKGLNETKTIDVLGTQVAIDMAPARIDFTTQGGVVELDTTMRAVADANGKYVYVDNALPAMDLSHGFQLAVADDAANQLLGSLWNAKGLDKTIMLKTSNYGEVGKLYDQVKIEAAAPPFVDASGDGLNLTVGDLVATFSLQGSPATAVAINAEMNIKVVKGQDGLLRFDPGTPTAYVDILDENIEGANQLSNAEFEAIVSFAVGRAMAVGAGSLGAIPLPTVGGVSLKNLSIGEQTGYLVVAGEVQ